MADVQLEKGFTQLANELLEILGQFKFTRLQMIAIATVWRFSYGFHKLYADFPKQSDIAMYGIPTQKVGGVLRTLEEKGVFKIDWDLGRIWFVKDYDKWDQSLKVDCFDMKRHEELLVYNQEVNHIATILGWNKASRGGGRKPARFTKSESTGSRKVNQADGNASKDKASTDIGSLKVNQNRFTKSESNDELGSRIVNQQVHETVIKAGLNPSNNVHLQPPKYRSKYIRSSSSVTNRSINTGSQEVCQKKEEEEFFSKKKEEGKEAITHVMDKIKHLWKDFKIDEGSKLMLVVEDLAQYPRKAIQEAFRAAKNKNVRRGNFNWLLERLRNPTRYGLKDYAEEASREEKRRTKDRLGAAGEAINKAYGNDGKWQPYRGTDEDDAAIESLLVFTTIEKLCERVTGLSKEKLNAPDVLPRLEREFGKF